MFLDLLKFCNLKNPLFRVFLFMSFFGLVAFSDLLIPTPNNTERIGYIVKFIFTFITSGAVFYLVHYGFGKLNSNPINFLFSTWIVFLLIHPTNDLWIFPFAIVAIALGKFIFKKNNIPIFNPAAMAITITYLFTKLLNVINPSTKTLIISWWGADMFQNITRDIPILNIIVPVFFVLSFLYCANLFKKIPYIIAFYIPYLILAFLSTLMISGFDKALSAASIAIFNATAFAVLVMLPEPKTSPNFKNQQLIIGSISGVALFVFNKFLGDLPVESLINTILLANVLTLLLKINAQKPKVAV